MSLAPRPLPLTIAAAADEIGELRIVHLAGGPYELGRQHAEALGDEVRKSVETVLGYFRRYLKIPLLRAWLASWWLGRIWWKAKPFVSAEHLEELQGLADGSGVPLVELYRLHAVPDRTYSCASLAAWGSMTVNGRLIHTRNLDWSIDVGIQEFATVFVVRPHGAHAFLNIGWAGFIGVLTGINDAQVSIGQIGAETVDVNYAGMPMIFVMRRIMERSGDVDAAVQVIRESPRTVGVNYVIADAHARRAVAVETTRRHAQVFEADDPKEHGVSYARPMAHAVFRADTAIDPTIRERQFASKGDPRRLGLEPPMGSAYEVRYLGQAEGLARQRGRLTPEGALAIAQDVAPDSNIQSVVFAWPDVWIANAHGATPAAQRPYHHVNAKRLLHSE